MILGVEHRMAFAYDSYISESFLEARVQPKNTPHQTVGSFVLSVGPPTRVFRYSDWHENVVHHFSITRYHNRIEVSSRSVVQTHPSAPSLASVTDALPLADLSYGHGEFLQFGGPVQLTSTLRKFQRSLPATRGARLGEHVRAIGQTIQRSFSYQKDVTRYDSTTEDFFKAGAGVCQDFAHLMLASLRLAGIPCRYVSGYLHQETRRAEPSQSHAWIEFHSPTEGWVPYDPTHDSEIDERYVVVGHGRTYDDVPPNKGIYRGRASETLSAEVRMRTATARALPTLQDTVQAIDVPVYTEIPGRKRDADDVAALEAAQQQQQQQQQG